MICTFKLQLFVEVAMGRLMGLIGLILLIKLTG